MGAHHINMFAKAHPLAGAILWFANIQYYVVQTVAAVAWVLPFSLLHNTISDLGNTACAQYGRRFVCSPLHPLMNVSFILLGVTIIAGATLLYASLPDSQIKHRNIAAWSFVAMSFSGIGSIFVGLFPENSISLFHVGGAALSFIFGNLALLGFAIGLQLPRWLKAATLSIGVLALIALILFQQKLYLGLDIGGMERIVAYPQSLWMILYGLYRIRKR